MIKITPSEFDIFTKYILKISGIFLAKGKEYLIETRIGPLLKNFSCNSFAELYKKASSDPKKIIEKKIIDAISTNETYFFRDSTPFELLQHKIIPDLIDKKKSQSKNSSSTTIRIWSAACSTGQEIYSIAIILEELNLNLPKYNIQLLGTDISNTVIAQASYGKYNKFEVGRGLPAPKRERFFTFSDNNTWRIKDKLRAKVSFKKMNLIIDPFASLGKFDIIFCRNVAIYFTAQDRKTLFNKLCKSMTSDGYFLIGSTESIAADAPFFKPKRYLRSVYYELE